MREGRFNFHPIVQMLIMAGAGYFFYILEHLFQRYAAPVLTLPECTTVGYITAVWMLNAASGPSPLSVPMAFALVFYGPEIWAMMHATFPEWWHFAIVAAAIASVVYWVNGLLLLCIELFWFPERLAKFKIQKNRPHKWVGDKKGQFGKTWEWNWPQVWAVTRNIISGQLFGILPCSFVLWGLHGRGFGIYLSEAPPNPWIITHDIFLYAVVNEITFYYAHRMLHWGPFYRWIHKVHHEFTAPVGLVAAYCHWVEMILANVVPLFLGAILAGSHGFTLMTWIVYAVLGTQTHHCGFHWPWMSHDHQPTFHDYHHEAFEANYGTLGWLDFLHGTDGNREATAAKKAAKAAAKARAAKSS